MFSEQAQSAYLSLQSKAMMAADSYILDRVERALDEISRNPNNTSPAAHQVRSAWANSRKVLDRRRQLAPQISIDAPAGAEPVELDASFAVVDALDWLEHAAVSDSDRHLLRGLADGADAHSLAEADGVGVQRMRERISRARRAAATDYRHTVVAA
jgi:hypothetical protein